MVFEGELAKHSFYTQSLNHTHRNIPEQPELPTIITLLSVLFSSADKPSCNACFTSLCVGGREWCLRFHIYFQTCRSSRALLLIMQMKCSLMDDNISLVTDSGLHKEWSIRQTERQIYSRGRHSKGMQAAIGGSGLIYTSAHSNGIILHVWHRERDEVVFRLSCVLIFKSDCWLHPE